MPRTTALSRWVHRPHRRTWLADTRDPDWSAGRLMRGTRPGGPA